MLDHSPRWTLRRRVVVLIAVVLTAGALFSGWTWYQAGAELRAAMAEAAADDPHWQLRDIEAHRKVIPDSENGALVILEGLRLAKAAPANTLKLLNAGNAAGNSLNVVDNVAQQSELSQIMRDCGPAIAELRKLRHLRVGRFPVTIADDPMLSVFPRQQETLRACWLLRAAMNDRVEAGDSLGAFDDLIAMFHLGRNIGDEPSLLAMLVRIAIDGACVDATERFLATCVPTDGQLFELQGLIEVELADPVALWGMRGERAGQFCMYEYFCANPQAAARSGAAPAGWQSWMLVFPGVLARNQVKSLRKSNEIVVISRMPIEIRREAIGEAAKPDSTLDVLTQSVSRSMLRGLQEETIRQARLRLLLVGLTAERYRQKHDQWSDTPDALVTDGLLQSLPIDPYIGKPLRWEKSSFGRVIVSRGEPLSAYVTSLLSSEQMENRTISFRLFDPDKRRQPAPPPKAE
ncbi:MAG: hypothetical protein K1X57_10075 [Gemmataceae bacterium]|nr:hypothetical protein [Gemmataceae bacterium]